LRNPNGVLAARRGDQVRVPREPAGSEIPEGILNRDVPITAPE